jgi:hypothetical protein
VLSFAPRIPPRLLQQLAHIDDPSMPIAVTHRRLGTRADAMGITRPSYERVRVLVHRLRSVRRPAGVVRSRTRLAVGTRALELFVEHGIAFGVRRRE